MMAAMIFLSSCANRTTAPKAPSTPKTVDHGKWVVSYPYQGNNLVVTIYNQTDFFLKVFVDGFEVNYTNKKKKESKEMAVSKRGIVPLSFAGGYQTSRPINIGVKVYCVYPAPANCREGLMAQRMFFAPPRWSGGLNTFYQQKDAWEITSGILR